METPQAASLEEFWDKLYAERDRIWSGRPNVALVSVAEGLPPGTALDLGCGEGGDAVWLAEQGWRVTAVDVAQAALDRLAAAALERGVADRIATERHELNATFPAGEFDLVTASFLQVPPEYDFPRERLLRRAAEAVAPGGLLVLVSHATGPSWSEHRHVDFPTVESELADLALDPAGWRVERADQAGREARHPDGPVDTILDNVVAVRRLPG